MSPCRAVPGLVKNYPTHPHARKHAFVCRPCSSRSSSCCKAMACHRAASSHQRAEGAFENSIHGCQPTCQRLPSGPVTCPSTGRPLSSSHLCLFFTVPNPQNPTPKSKWHPHRPNHTADPFLHAHSALCVFLLCYFSPLGGNFLFAPFPGIPSFCLRYRRTRNTSTQPETVLSGSRVQCEPNAGPTGVPDAL